MCNHNVGGLQDSEYTNISALLLCRDVVGQWKYWRTWKCSRILYFKCKYRVYHLSLTNRPFCTAPLPTLLAPHGSLETGKNSLLAQHRITELFELKRTFEGPNPNPNLVQIPCNGQGHLQLDQAAQTSLSRSHACLAAHTLTEENVYTPRYKI